MCIRDSTSRTPEFFCRSPPTATNLPALNVTLCDFWSVGAICLVHILPSREVKTAQAEGRRPTLLVSPPTATIRPCPSHRLVSGKLVARSPKDQLIASREVAIKPVGPTPTQVPRPKAILFRGGPVSSVVSPVSGVGPVQFTPSR